MGARAFSQSGLGAGRSGAISIWISSGAVAMGCFYCTSRLGTERFSLFALRYSPDWFSLSVGEDLPSSAPQNGFVFWLGKANANSEKRRASQRVQIRHQPLELLRRQLLLEAWHLGAAEQDDVGYAIVVRRHAIFHVRPLEQPSQAGAAQVALAVGVVAFSAARIVNPAPVGLLRVEPKFCVRLARLGVAGGKDRDRDENDGR